jgi:hypothetical protein
MTLSLRNHVLAITAALLCTFATVGASIAPAIHTAPIQNEVI